MTDERPAGLGCLGWICIIGGLLVVAGMFGLPAYQRRGLGTAIREQRAREDVVIAAIRQIGAPGLVTASEPDRLSEDEIREGYAVSRTPFLDIFMCGDVCSSWTPDSVTESEVLLTGPASRPPDEVCRALLARFATADPVRLTVNERGLVTPRGCGLEGRTGTGVELQVAVNYQYYTPGQPVHVLVSGMLPRRG